MKIVNRKTRKAIRKGLKKVVKKHGAQIVAGLAAAVASSLATLASTDAPGTRHKQSNLRKISGRVSDMLTPPRKKSRKPGSKKAHVVQRESVERSAPAH